MTIDGVGRNPVRPGGAGGLEDQEVAESPARAPSTEGSAREDQVEISEAGRDLARADDIFRTDPARVALIEGRLADGVYHTPEVAERIAQRLIPDVT